MQNGLFQLPEEVSKKVVDLRDECFDKTAKTANLSSLFPCGDHMVCIIDDREDVWSFAPNLVHVKPYNYFKVHIGDMLFC